MFATAHVARRAARLCVVLLAAGASQPASAAELWLGLGHYDRVVSVQDPVRYELSVTNTAIDPALDVHLWFRSNTQRVLTAEGDGWSCANHPQAEWVDIECIRQSLDAGASTNVRIVIEAMAAPGSFTPAIWVSALNDPSNSYQNPTTDVYEAPSPPPPADLDVTAAYPNPVHQRDHVRYAMTVNNLWENHARGVSLSFEAPYGTRVVAASGESWSCTIGWEGASCAMDHVLPAHGATVVTVVLEATSWPGDMAPTIRLTASSHDPVPENNVLYASTTVEERLVDLAIGVVDSADPVGAGSEYSYTVSVRNESPIPTNSVSASLRIPDGVQLLAVESAGWWCSNGPQDVYCWHEDWLAPGEAFSIVVRVRAPGQAGDVVARAEAGSFWYADPSHENNVAYHTTSVSSCSADAYASAPTAPDYRVHTPGGKKLHVVVDDDKCVQVDEQVKLP